MRILLFSDIHGNVAALDAVLADRHRHGPYDLIICAGDLLWAGPRPREVMARIRELCDDDPRSGGVAVCLQGNTDLFLLEAFAYGIPDDKRKKRFRRQREWMLGQLSSADLIFLRRLPLSHRISPAAGHDLLAVHANPRNVDDPIFPGMSDEEIGAVIGDEIDWSVLAYGHIHIPSVQRWRGRLLVNVASVGLPRDGNTAAAYSILTWTGDVWQVDQHRVPYDVEAVAVDMRQRDLPRGKHFARRLLAARYE